MNHSDNSDVLALLEESIDQVPVVTQGPVLDRANSDWPIDVLDTAHGQERSQLEDLRAHLSRTAEQLTSSFRDFGAIDASPPERHRAQRILRALVHDEFVGAIHTIDFTLELRRRDRLANARQNAAVYYFLISVAGWPDALERENHDFGYHFHYVETSRRATARTNVLLTFDPTERMGPPDTLYWEYHGGYKRADPLRWSRKRCIAVHTAAKPSVLKPGKIAFKRPDMSARALYAK